MKQLGDILTRSKEHSLAKRVYTNAIDMVPPASTLLERKLISSRSYMYELLGNYSGALNDARKLERSNQNWAEVRETACFHMKDISK